MGLLAPNILKTAAIGKHNDGGGLYLLIKGRDGKGRPNGSWVYRYTFLSKRHDMGLGSIQTLTLAQARLARDRWNEMKSDPRNPINPIEEMRRLEAEARIGDSGMTLSEVAPLAFEAIKGRLKDDGNAGRWFSPLRLHVLPALGSMNVEDIHQRDIEQTLRSIWQTKNPTAQKALDRLGIVIKHAAAMGFDVNQNAVPNAKQLLGHSAHVINHHPALPFVDIPKFYQSLQPDSVAQRALMFYILVVGGPRLKPVRFAHVDQFSDGIWTIDGKMMKSGKGNIDNFRVPVTVEMQSLIDLSISKSIDGFLFPSPHSKVGRSKVISDQAIEKIMRNCETELDWDQPYRPHGIRATFRSWVSDVDPNLYLVAEKALAHNIAGTVERTYDRNDLLEPRRELMEKWTAYLTENGS